MVAKEQEQREEEAEETDNRKEFGEAIESAKKAERERGVGKKAVWVNRYLERDTSEKSGEKYRIVCRIDYVIWAKLQARAKRKNMPLSSLRMNILEEQIIKYKKNEIKCGMSESQTNNPI